MSIPSEPRSVYPSEILQITGPEIDQFDPTLADGGLPPAVGVQSFQVFRASRDVPEQTDDKGWTYHHHVDMACWRGRLYVGWNSCRQDEDVWPSRELFSWSVDGRTWSGPAELFPQGVSTPLRMYFYRAANDRMLVIAGLRWDHDNTDEDKKGALVVRELRADHTWGEVYALQYAATGSTAAQTGNAPPIFETSADDEFKNACRLLLADRMYLEQQDRGKLLGNRKMKWHDATAWAGGVVPGDNAKWVSGKAFSFFKRPDGAWVGISKMGWTTISFDEGNTWSEPAVPSTLITGKAKVWSQQTADGRYALVYNPLRSKRYPLVIVTSDDGVNFNNMRLVQGELPIQRYAGIFRSIGPQYVRGITHWATDGSRNESAMWLVYSMNKEDIWISRVPIPVKADEDRQPTDRLWNIYCPKWTTVEIKENRLTLTTREPYDYAEATRVIPETTHVTIQFDLSIDDPKRAHLEIDLVGKFGSNRMVQLVVAPGSPLLPAQPNRPAAFRLEADSVRGTYSIMVNDQAILRDQPMAQPLSPFQRIVLRTGPFRNIGGTQPVDPGSDKPLDPLTYDLQSFAILNTRSGDR